MTPYQKHVASWKNCQRCELSGGRRKVCLVRGVLPCQVLFVGEAPGASEDVLGSPFCGPAGHLLDDIVEESGVGDLRFAVTNLVGCFPKEAKKAKNHEPPKEAILACAPRLVEITKICNPQAIVRVGKLSTKWTGVALEDHAHTLILKDIVHPASILRMDVTQQGLAMQRCVVTLKELVEELYEGET